MQPISRSFVLRVSSALVLMPVVLFDLVYGGLPFLIMLVLAAALSLKEWYGMSKQSNDFMFDLSWGAAYIILCFLSFAHLRMHFDGGEWLALALLLSVWASDTGAYFAGKTFKGPKMCPSISPNKTWAGLAGGVVSSALAFYAFAIAVGPYLAGLLNKSFHFAGLNDSSFVLLVLGASVTIAGQAGDLLISRQKRKVGVKDTGNLIPGHGGILDRIDSLLLCSLVFVVILFVMK